MSQARGEFYDGVIAALGVLVIHDQVTAYDEIVRSVDEEELISRARRMGAMRWSGLDEYVRRERRRLDMDRRHRGQR